MPLKGKLIQIYYDPVDTKWHTMMKSWYALEIEKGPEEEVLQLPTYWNINNYIIIIARISKTQGSTLRVW